MDSNLNKIFLELSCLKESVLVVECPELITVMYTHDV